MRALLAACLLAAAAGARAATVTLVVREGDERAERLAGLVESRLKDGVSFRRVSYSVDQLSDPRFKGRLVASLASSPLVVSIGDEPTRLSLGELEETPVYFVGAAYVSGGGLTDDRVAGLLGYSADDVFAALPAPWKAKVGLLYTPGYERALGPIRASARAAGVTLAERRIEKPRDIPRAARALLETAKALWVLGDPSLSLDAGFEYLAETALAADVPLISATPGEVRRGAVFCSLARPESLAQEASRAIAGLLDPASASYQIALPPKGGLILYNKALAARYGLATSKPGWSEAR